MANTIDKDTPMTERQQQVLDAILDHWRQNYTPPTIRELGDALGIASPNGINGHLKALRKRGKLLADVEHKARRIVPVEVVALLKEHL